MHILLMIIMKTETKSTRTSAKAEHQGRDGKAFDATADPQTTLMVCTVKAVAKDEE